MPFAAQTMRAGHRMLFHFQGLRRCITPSQPSPIQGEGYMVRAGADCLIVRAYLSAATEAPMKPRDYGPFPYVPITDRPKLTWPNGARLAVWIVPNIEFFPLSIGIPGSPYDTSVPAAPTVRAWAQRDYGNRVGIWRIMEVLQKRGIRACANLNSDICDHHPQIVKAAVELGWEILGHNETNSRWLNQMERDEERQSIARALAKIAA